MSRVSSSQEEHEVSIPLQETSASTRRPKRVSSTRYLFERCDTNRDGQVSLQELVNLIKAERHSAAADLPESAVQRLMSKADADQNGYLNYEEFKQLMASSDWQSLMQRAVQQYVRHTIPRRPVSARDETVPDGGDETSIEGEYERQYTCWPPALGMIIISVVEIILFLIDLIHSGTVDGDGPVALKLLYTPYRRYEAWRFLTYMFVHVGVYHLVVNLLVQILLGIPLEMVHHWWRVLIIYFAGVIAGSLGTSITDPYVRLAGASGGVYAILLAHIATIIMNWSEMVVGIYQLVVLLILIGTDVGSAIYYRYFAEVEQQIGYSAHFAGALAGLLLGINVLRNLRVKSWEKKLWWASIIIYVILMTIAILWNIFYTDYFPEQDWN